MDKKRLKEITKRRKIEDICESLQECWADMEDHHAGYYPDEKIERMYEDTEMACTILRELAEETKQKI